MFLLVALAVFALSTHETYGDGLHTSIGFGSGHLGGGGYFSGGGGDYLGGIGHGNIGSGIGLGGGGFGHGIGFGGGGLGFGKYIGGAEVDNGFYGGGKKNLNHENFFKSHGSKLGELNHGGAGFSKGEELAKNVKGESAHFADAFGGKNLFHDGKEYHGGQHFEKEGHGGDQKALKKGHKKGHTVKGFKSSHHKDEHGETNEYYDEEHDEGGNYAFQGQKGDYGEKGGSAFKGGHVGGKFNAEEAKKAGHFDKESLVGKAHGNHGKFGEHKFAEHGGVVGEHKLLGNDDVSGHHESSKAFKHVPIHYRK